MKKLIDFITYQEACKYRGTGHHCTNSDNESCDCDEPSCPAFEALEDVKSSNIGIEDIP